MTTVLSTHLVEGHDVNAATEVDVLRVQAIDSLLLQTLLSKRIVRRQCWEEEEEDIFKLLVKFST